MMRFKKLSLILVPIIIVLILSSTVSADGEGKEGIPEQIPEFVFDVATEPSKEDTLFQVDRPSSNECFREDYCVVSGNAKEENVNIMVMTLDYASRRYQPVELEGKKVWSAGKSGFFALKGVPLKKGLNTLRIYAFLEEAPEEGQITDISVRMIGSSFLSNLKSSIFNLTDAIRRLLR